MSSTLPTSNTNANPNTTTTSTDTPKTPFNDPTLDPADYINNALPPLTLAGTQPNASRAPGSIPLPELSTQVQSLVAAVNAQNVRHAGTLTQLTDEILRGGGRLAYEVEVLRGETVGLGDILLHGGSGSDAGVDRGIGRDIGKFVPEGTETESTDEATETAEPKDEQKTLDPDYITKLRTLNQVRSRLDEVVHVFGDSMEWPVPPSELSLTSSFISVSAPDLGPEAHSLEQKGQEIMKQLRTEVSELLESNGGGEAGLEAASRRVDALRTLALVWKGTAEEKARNRFVDGLAKIVEDRQKALESASSSPPGPLHGLNQQHNRGTAHQRQVSEGPGGGIFKNLQRLREEIYLE